MRNILIILLLCVLTLKSQVNVKGYYRSNGTYVQPHTRSSPDGNPYNNYSYPGNYNPNTGQTSTGNASTYLENYYNRSNTTKSSSDVWVDGYYRSDGTYVKGHWRSAPNGDPYDNFSFPGNTNPYTGKVATGNPETYLENYYVTSSSLNVRSGPSTDYEVTNKLNYGDKINVIEKYDDNWFRIKIYTTYPNYEFGYINSCYVSSSDSQSNENSNNDGYNFKSKDDLTSNSAIVNTSVLNVRNGASTDHPIITTLGYGEEVEVLYKANSNWTAVKVTYVDEKTYTYKTTTGYVFSTFLSSTDPITSSSIDYSNYFNNNSYVEPSQKTSYKTSTAYSPNTYHPYGDGNGKISFWTDCGTDGEISVYIDDYYIGKLTQHFINDSKPDCDSDGTVATTISAGLHKMVAKGQKFKWEGYVTIYADRCLLQHLKK